MFYMFCFFSRGGVTFYLQFGDHQLTHPGYVLLVSMRCRSPSLNVCVCVCVCVCVYVCAETETHYHSVPNELANIVPRMHDDVIYIKDDITVHS